jgi:hypothetical protein
LRDNKACNGQREITAVLSIQTVQNVAPRGKPATRMNSVNDTYDCNTDYASAEISNTHYLRTMNKCDSV